MGLNNYFTEFPSPLGRLQLRGTPLALHALCMAEHRHGPPLPGDAQRDDAPLRPAREQVEEFLAGQRVYFSLPFEMRGTPFQLRVWKELLSIPYGQTASYGEIAKRIGSPGAGRAVGSANGRNPLLIVVPCHRVIGANGALSGYGGGPEQKRFLLMLEWHTVKSAADMEQRWSPDRSPQYQPESGQRANPPHNPALPNKT